MTLQLRIDSRTEDRLRRQAQAAGQDVEAYVARLVNEAVARPSVEEVLEPLRREFAASGMTEDELLREITAARDEYRASQDADR